MLEKISPADVLRRMANNLDEDKKVSTGLYDCNGVEWSLCCNIKNVIKESYIKKPTRTITLELPMPLTEMPENASKVHWAHIEGYGTLVDCRKTKIERLLERSMLYETEKDAKAAHEELKAKFWIDNIVESE